MSQQAHRLTVVQVQSLGCTKPQQGRLVGRMDGHGRLQADVIAMML